MYSQPSPHPNQLQHAFQSFDSNVPADQHPPQGVIGNPQFANGLGYSFQNNISASSPMVSMQDTGGAVMTGPYTPGSMHSSIEVASGPPAQTAASSSVPRTAADEGFGASKPAGPSTDDGTTQSNSSPALGDSIDDLAADEFELSSGGRGDGTDLGARSKDGGNDAPPSWSELKTKAGKDRKRLPLACIACRRKKIRCSGEKPACKHCLRSRIPCVYKVTTRKAAPRTDYMAMLDKRLKRMEERIIKIIPKSDQKSTSTVTRAVVKPSIPSSMSSKGGSKKRGADEAFGLGLDAWAKTSTKNKKIGLDEEGSQPLDALDIEDSQLSQDGIEILPSKEIQEHLAEVYFENVYGQAYHLLHKPSYMRKLKWVPLPIPVLSTPDSGYHLTCHRSDTLPPVLVLSVCAVAARFSASPKLNSTTRQFLRGEEWAAPAREICTRRYESPNITILTCILILGLHEFGTCQGGRSWSFGGQAIRMAFALQLHKDLEYDPMSKNGRTQLSFIDREIRRRIMWACFIMDRFISSGRERPMFIEETAIDLPLPVKERYFQLDMPAVTETLDGRVLPGQLQEDDTGNVDTRENMGVAAYMIRIIALWGRSVAYANQGGKERDPRPISSRDSVYMKLVNEAEEFSSTLTESLVYNWENLSLHNNHNTANQFLLLHLTIQQTNLSLSVLALSSSEEDEDTHSSARRKALVAANRISAILKDAEGSRYPITAPFAGYCAFSSTVLLIQGIVSGEASLRAQSEVNSTANIRFIRKMMKYWGMLHWLEEDIRAKYRVAMDRSRSGLPPAEMMSPILQYGDWFARYPHGVVDLEFMDTVSQKKKEKGADGVLEQKPELQSVEEFFTTLASPEGDIKQEGTKSATSKRKATAKKQASTGLSGSQQPPPFGLQKKQQQRISTTTSSQAKPQLATSGPVEATSDPGSFQPAQAPAPPPMSMDHYGHAAQNFYAPHMLSVDLQQPQNHIMQPLDQQLPFGGYALPAANMEPGQNLMGGASDWSSTTPRHGTGPDPKPNHHLLMNGHPHGHLAHNGINVSIDDPSAAWYMSYGLEPTQLNQEMAMDPRNADAFNNIYNNNGMSTSNPLGGLRHAQ